LSLNSPEFVSAVARDSSPYRERRLAFLEEVEEEAVGVGAGVSVVVASPAGVAG
jgi:hypothetical protein